MLRITADPLPEAPLVPAPSEPFAARTVSRMVRIASLLRVSCRPNRRLVEAVLAALIMAGPPAWDTFGSKLDGES